MPVVLTGLAFALAASVAQGTGFLAQHLTAAERPPVSLRRPLRTLVSMLRSSSWRMGLLFASTGFLLHLGALALAPISLVQAFVAGGLALVVPILGHATWHLYRRLVEAEGGPHPTLREPPTERRYAADFPAVLFPWIR